VHLYFKILSDKIQFCTPVGRGKKTLVQPKVSLFTQRERIHIVGSILIDTNKLIIIPVLFTSGNGWAIMGKADTLLTLADMGFQDSTFEDLLSIFKSHCLALKAVQSSGGGWHNVVTSSDTFVETSGTAMNIYAFIKVAIFICRKNLHIHFLYAIFVDF
jgi:hypothetical protein